MKIYEWVQFYYNIIMGNLATICNRETIKKENELLCEKKVDFDDKDEGKIKAKAKSEYHLNDSIVEENGITHFKQKPITMQINH